MRPLIVSQGAGDLVRASLAIFGQCRIHQAFPHPSPPRFRPHVEVDATSHATLNPATVEAIGLVVPVGDEEDGGGLAGTPVGELVEGAEVSVRLGASGTRGFQAHRPPQTRYRPEILLFHGPHDDILSALGHATELTLPGDGGKEYAMRWEYTSQMMLFEETEEGLVAELDWLEEAGDQGWELASAVPLIAPNRDGVAYGTVGLFAILKRSAGGSEPT